ncbi:hypothetical protein FRC05_008936, partial [Tulasnella sp. 425]
PTTESHSQYAKSVLGSASVSSWVPNARRSSVPTTTSSASRVLCIAAISSWASSCYSAAFIYPHDPQAFVQRWETYGTPGANIQTQFLHPPPILAPSVPANDAPTEPNQDAPSQSPSEDANAKKRKRTRGGKKQTTADAPPGKQQADQDQDQTPNTISTDSTAHSVPTFLSGVGPIATAPAPVAGSAQSPDTPVSASSKPTAQTALPSHPPAALVSQNSQPKKNLTLRAASDCWAFLRLLETKEEPVERPNPETEKDILTKPNSPWAGCKLCKEEWTVWRCADSMTTHYRNHLASWHWDEWIQLCKMKKISIKGKWADKAGNGEREKSTSAKQGEGSTVQTEPFNTQGFLKRLVQWLVSNYQSINIVENRFFRELLIFVSNGTLNEDDIPHRTRITNLIRNAATLERQHMQKEMQLGYITLDNASNCDTLVDQVSEELEALNIGFSREQNRLRCFPHVVNLAVQDFPGNLSSELPPDVAAIYGGNDLLTLQRRLNEETFDSEDIVHRIRGLVAALRVSGQRRESFRRIIASGNSGRLWDDTLEIWKAWWVEMDPDGRTMETEITLPVVQLLRNCPTRWSLTFIMIHHFLELYPAINHFVNTTDELNKFKLSRSNIERLINIHHALSIPHAAQQLLSFESTPTLSLTLPLYESLVTKWEELKASIPELQNPLAIGIRKIRDYITKTHKSDVYTLAIHKS